MATSERRFLQPGLFGIVGGEDPAEEGGGVELPGDASAELFELGAGLGVRDGPIGFGDGCGGPDDGGVRGIAVAGTGMRNMRKAARAAAIGFRIDGGQAAKPESWPCSAKGRSAMDSSDVDKFLAASGETQESMRIRNAWDEDIFKAWVGDVVFLDTVVYFVSQAAAIRIPIGVPMFLTFVAGDVGAAGGEEAGAILGAILAAVVLFPLARTINTRSIARTILKLDRAGAQASVEQDRAMGSLRSAVKHPSIDYRGGKLRFLLGEDEFFFVNLAESRYQEYAPRITEFESRYQNRKG